MRFYVIVVVLSLLPLLHIFITSDLHHTHDGLVHLPRIAAYYKALLDGQFPVRWAGDLNYGYGMPLFNFIYQLPYLIASLLIALGFGLVSAFKFTLAVSFVFSGIFMLIFSRAFFRDDKKALVVTLFYQFSPFRLVEGFIRGSFGEVYTYTFLPLVLFGLVRIFQGSVLFGFALTCLATALLVLSHNSVSLLFFGTALLFALLFGRNRKTRVLGILGLLSGLLLSAFYWIPAIFEHKYTHADLFMRGVYREHFPPFVHFFIPNPTNASILQTNGVSVQIGFFHFVSLLASLGTLIWDRGDKLLKRVASYGLLLVVLSLFFMHPLSTFVWEHLSFLRQFQFPWRFLSVVSFATAILSATLLAYPLFRRKIVFRYLLVLLVISTIVYWKPGLGYDKVDEGYYWNFPLTTTYYGETNVVWSAGPAVSYPKERIEIIAGEGVIQKVSKKSNLHTFTIEATTDVSVVDKTQYFPGWRVYVDGRSVPIQFQDPNWRGLIQFSTASGYHNVRVVFEESKLRLAADLVSGLSFTALTVATLLRARRRI